MGQSSSSQREQRHSSPPVYTVHPSPERSRSGRSEDMDVERHTESTRESQAQQETEVNADSIRVLRSNRPLSTPDPWPLATLSRGITLQRGIGNTQEDGTQFDINNREYRSTVFTRMAARRQSTMSRLGSRILPNSVIRGLLSSEEETPAEGLAHRHGIVSRSILRSETVHGSNRFSSFGSLGSRGIARRRSTRGPYSLPRVDQALISGVQGSPQLGALGDRSPEVNRGTRRRSARLHRVRNSLSNPITHIFGSPSSNAHGESIEGHEHQPAHPTSEEASDIRSRTLRPMESRMDFEELSHELGPTEPAMRNTRPPTPIPLQTNDASGSLRTTPSHTLRREEPTPLSRVLQLAAAAIAAQLSGGIGPVVPNIQSLGNDDLGGSFENFIQTLQQSASAQANDAAATNGQRLAGDSRSPSPTNFLRVFRFSNPSLPNESGNAGVSTDHMDIDTPGEGHQGRTVTLVVVGVRSVLSSDDMGDRPPNTGPGLDALLRLPFLPPGNARRSRDNGPSGTPRAIGYPRMSPGRRQPASSNVRTGNPDANVLEPRRASDAGAINMASSFPTILSESPPGPNPPPSTPADPGLSAVSSSASTPSRRPSSASAMSTNVVPHFHEYQRMQSTAEPTDSSALADTTRQRRRSDSEYARHRGLGLGSTRRNGVIEPDDTAPPTGRSWLIYVVGTNLSENHPAFATPSLFTDNPTYEDMILLSSLLGPAKPPVATREDVNSAGGLYRLMEYGGSLVAEEIDGSGTLQVREGDRCLICLSDYEAAEEVRQLTGCRHVYHRECIDQWLTTGRNSCPLCRGQGVTEHANPSAEAPSASA